MRADLMSPEPIQAICSPSSWLNCGDVAACVACTCMAGAATPFMAGACASGIGLRVVGSVADTSSLADTRPPPWAASRLAKGDAAAAAMGAGVAASASVIWSPVVAPFAPTAASVAAATPGVPGAPPRPVIAPRASPSLPAAAVAVPSAFVARSVTLGGTPISASTLVANDVSPSVESSFFVVSSSVFLSVDWDDAVLSVFVSFAVDAVVAVVGLLSDGWSLVLRASACAASIAASKRLFEAVSSFALAVTEDAAAAPVVGDGAGVTGRATLRAIVALFMRSTRWGRSGDCRRWQASCVAPGMSAVLRAFVGLRLLAAIFRFAFLFPVFRRDGVQRLRAATRVGPEQTRMLQRLLPTLHLAKLLHNGHVDLLQELLPVEQCRDADAIWHLGVLITIFAQLDELVLGVGQRTLLRGKHAYGVLGLLFGEVDDGLQTIGAGCNRLASMVSAMPRTVLVRFTGSSVS